MPLKKRPRQKKRFQALVRRTSLARSKPKPKRKPMGGTSKAGPKLR